MWHGVDNVDEYGGKFKLGIDQIIHKLIEWIQQQKKNTINIPYI